MADHDFGTALQMVILDPENNKVGVNEESMKVLAANLNSLKADKVSLVSVMGAYRGGKSFILDIFLRYLRWEDSVTAAGGTPPGPREAEFPREKGGAYPTPDWLLHGGEQLEGVEDENGKQNGHGFKTKGGMDTCTEGVWIWSKPFLRVINGVRVALLVMDTQGAWDGDLTPKQSATIFGLTAVLSSKLIYNVKQQIDEASGWSEWERHQTTSQELCELFQRCWFRWSIAMLQRVWVVIVAVRYLLRCDCFTVLRFLLCSDDCLFRAAAAAEVMGATRKHGNSNIQNDGSAGEQVTRPRSFRKCRWICHAAIGKLTTNVLDLNVSRSLRACVVSCLI